MRVCVCASVQAYTLLKCSNRFLRALNRTEHSQGFPVHYFQNKF